MTYSAFYFKLRVTDELLFASHLTRNLRLDSVLALGEVGILLRLLRGLGSLFGSREPAANRARLLRAQIKGQVLLPRVRLPEVLELVLANHGEHLRDGQTDNLDFGKLVGRAAGNLRHAQRRELGLQLLELVQKVTLAALAELIRLETSCVGRNGRLRGGRSAGCRACGGE